MNKHMTVTVTLDPEVDAYEASRVIEAGMPIEEVEMLMAPIAFDPITEEEWEVIATEIPREMALHLREIEAEAAHDRRFGLV